MWAAEDYFQIDLAEIGHLISPGKSHCMTYRCEGSRYVKDPNGGYRVQRFTRWVSARLTRRQPDALTVQITSKMNPDANPARARVTVRLTERPNTVGGTRTWLTCPDCERPVRVLYWARHLHCRKCAGLKHRSAITFKTQRQMKRERELHLMLGGNGDHREAPPAERPRYMHRKRHEALRFAYITTAVPLGIVRRRREERRLKSVVRLHRGLLARLEYPGG